MIAYIRYIFRKAVLRAKVKKEKVDTAFRMLRASSTTDIIDLASPSPSSKKRARTENAASSSAAPLVPNPEFA